jgi:hypothetical protein
MNKKAEHYGHTLMELVMAILIFSLFLTGAFAVFSYGLKSWKLVETKSDVQNQAEVAMGRILSELISTDIETLLTDKNVPPSSPVIKWVAFETAVNSATGDVEKENASLIWKGYILYYTSPSDAGKPDKKLLRKYIPHADRTTPKQIDLTKMSFYLTDTFNTGEELRTVARNIYNLDIAVNPNKYIVDLSLVTWKKFSETRLAYDKDFSDNAGQESVTLKASVMPRNSQD